MIALLINFEIKMHNTLLKLLDTVHVPTYCNSVSLTKYKERQNTQALKLGTCISWYFLNNQLYSTVVWIPGYGTEY